MIVTRAAFLVFAVMSNTAAPREAYAQHFIRGDVLLPPWYWHAPLLPPPRTQIPPPPPPAPAPQALGSLPSPAPSYWYCLDAGGYYPDVVQCPGGWQQVVPRTPPPPPTIELTPQGGTRLRPDSGLNTR